MNKTIEINARYYLLGHDGSYDVLDRALELQMLPAMVFANGTEKECRDWILRNCEEPEPFSDGAWIVTPPNEAILQTVEGVPTYAISRPVDQCWIAQVQRKADATAIAALPALLALLEQYHKSFPTKESGKLIAQAKGWI